MKKGLSISIKPEEQKHLDKSETQISLTFEFHRRNRDGDAATNDISLPSDTPGRTSSRFVRDDEKNALCFCLNCLCWFVVEKVH
jgi:hypothetical protein